MSNLRVPFALVFGVLFSSAVFLALYQFISVPLNFDGPNKATAIEFTRKIFAAPLENKRDRKIERPPLPVVPTGNPTTLVTDTGSGERTKFVRTGLDLRIGTTTVDVDRHAIPVGVDRDVMPIVRVTPDYPPRAATHGIEGWVQIQFTVTATGAVRDPVVVAAEPKGEFEDAALKAIARWRYNPRIDGGVAVERVGLQTVLRFELQK
jgi:protein TonB